MDLVAVLQKEYLFKLFVETKKLIVSDIQDIIINYNFYGTMTHAQTLDGVWVGLVNHTRTSIGAIANLSSSFLLHWLKTTTYILKRL